jgi:hypothetical protein
MKTKSVKMKTKLRTTLYRALIKDAEKIAFFILIKEVRREKGRDEGRKIERGGREREEAEREGGRERGRQREGRQRKGRQRKGRQREG